MTKPATKPLCGTMAFENDIEGTPDVLFRVRGWTSAESMWVTDWYADCAKAIKKHAFLKDNGYEHVTFSKYELV